MTAPIDLPCPACESAAGNYCTFARRRDLFHESEPGEFPIIDGKVLVRVPYYHAERIDAAARHSDRARRGDPDRLRAALRQAIEGWSARDPEMHDAEARDAMRQEFDL